MLDQPALYCFIGVTDMNAFLKDRVGLLQEDERDDSATKGILVCFVSFLR